MEKILTSLLKEIENDFESFVSKENINFELIKNLLEKAKSSDLDAFYSLGLLYEKDFFKHENKIFVRDIMIGLHDLGYKKATEWLSNFYIQNDIEV